MTKIFTEDNLKSLKLTDEQKIIYADLEKRWLTLYNALNDCKLPRGAVGGIIAKSNLYSLDMGNIETLKEGIRQEYKDFIITRG